MSTSTNLRRARLRKGLSAIELADKAQTTETRVYSIERGRYRPQPREAERLAVALNSDVEALFPRGVQERVQL